MGRASGISSPDGESLGPVDRILVDALVENCRVSFTALAAKVGMSGSTVCRHISALEHRGIIRGYFAVIDPGALGEPTTALFSIKPRSDAPALRIAERLYAVPEITASYTLSGDRPHIAVGRFAGPDAAEVAARRLADDLCARVNIDFVLETRFGRMAWSPASAVEPVEREADRVMLDILMTDGRASLDALAKQANLSKSTVHKRLHVLRNRGVIRGFTTLVDAAALGRPVTAVFGIKSDTGAPVDPAAYERLGDFPEIATCYTLSGHRPSVAVGAYRDITAARTAADRLGEQLHAAVSIDFVLATDFDRHQSPRHGRGRRQWPHDATPSHLRTVR